MTWDALPRDTEEFELLLQCESPVPLTLRLTESEDPGIRSFSWRVPDLPSLVARIVIRRGESGGEIQWARSEPFQISGSRALSDLAAASRPAGKGAPRVISRGGELWLQTNAPRGAEESAQGDEHEELSGRSEGAIVAGVVSVASKTTGGMASPVNKKRVKRSQPAARMLSRRPLSVQLRI